MQNHSEGDSVSLGIAAPYHTPIILVQLPSGTPQEMNEVLKTKTAPSDLVQLPSGTPQGMNEVFKTKGAPSDLE